VGEKLTACRKAWHDCDTLSTSSNRAAASSGASDPPDREAELRGSPARERGPYIPATEAKRRILEAARALLRDRAFAALSVSAVMAEAGLTRTIFYRYFDDLPALAADLLPDAEDPLVDRLQQTEAERPEEVVKEMIDGLVATFAEHGPLLRAIDDAARHDPAVAAQLDTALVGPRRLIARLLRTAHHPPPDAQEMARLLMATHRAYLLDAFGDGQPRRGAHKRAREALAALWERLLS
jgi:AcrR family transcriptional regulator